MAQEDDTPSTEESSSDGDGAEMTEAKGSEEGSSGSDPSGKPTIDEPTAPALDPTPDEFDKQAEEAGDN